MPIVHHLPAVDRRDQEIVATWRDGLPPDEPASDRLSPLAQLDA